MGNQQGNDPEIDIAWLAGFTDGEGCLDLCKDSSKKFKIPGHIYYYPRYRVSNTHVDTLNKVTGILDKYSLPYWVAWRKPQKDYYKRSWSVEIVGVKRMLKLLRAITPYLYTKKDQAEAMLDLILSRLEKEAKEPYSNYEMELISFLRQPRRGSPSQTTR